MDMMGMQAAEPRGGNRVWLPALVLLCAGLLYWGLKLRPASVSDPAYLTGEMLIPALGVWGLFWAVLLRGRSGLLKFVAFAAVYAAMLGGVLTAAAQQREQARLAMISIRQELQRVVPMVGASGVPASAPSPLQMASGEFGEFERITKTFYGQAVQQRAAYEQELKDTGFMTLLDPHRAKADAGMAQGRKILAQARDVIEKYEDRGEALQDEYQKRVEATNVSEELKIGLRRGISKAKSTSDQVWQLEHQIVGEVEKLMVMLSNTKGWSAEGKNFVFASQADLDNFRQHMAAIQAMGSRQEQIQKTAMENARKGLDAAIRTQQ